MTSLPFDRKDLPLPCRALDFEGSSHVVCELDLRSYDIRLALNGIDGKPYGSLASFIAGQRLSAPLVLSMNAGMYEPDMRPVGLHVEDGRTIAPLNTNPGEGNFYMEPNGVFFVRHDGTAGILSTRAYAKDRPNARMATQSGPMSRTARRVSFATAWASAMCIRSSSPYQPRRSASDALRVCSGTNSVAPMLCSSTG
jgi:uncharacterized protein YigE (DUF2233 family)